ncbi:SulP family inorganic anion transporter [Sneathiella glossodoripedis]|uniref:SulP family inorganic anion transporter n=1 Tax=Sneathiella glossodoripedis TaxID=418853 RepID=UPI00046F7539|nr:sulfate permease [Sneathiella glossodoripedis]
MSFSTVFPAAKWLSTYNKSLFSGDLIAGIITAILLIPQAMAYSALAGLPPQIGLYASIAAPIMYALFGSSRTLAVGPVAVASLMVAYALGSIAEQGTASYLEAAILLSFMVGICFIGIAILRLGVLTEFLSHPVMAGFTSAAAIMIAFSQLTPFAGFDEKLLFADLLSIGSLISIPGRINDLTLVLGIVCLCGLYLIRKHFAKFLEKLPISTSLATGIAKTGPLIVLVFSSLAIWIFDMNSTYDVAVIGHIPAGLPELSVSSFNWSLVQELAPSAILITIVSFIESVAIAKVLASKRRERLNITQEAWGLGFANIGSGFTGASPVCGGFSRSVVNFSAGANTQLAAIITALIIGATLTFFTPLFYNVPKTVLAAIILIAILELVDLKGFLKNLRYDRADGVAEATTFLCVLFFGIETGLLAGIGISLTLHFWRSSRPHIAIVGQVGDSEHFRNVKRHKVKTYPHLLAIRIDESLFFANAGYLETYILNEVANKPELSDILLICSAVNAIDASALHTLEQLKSELDDSSVALHFAEIKGPVMDRLQATSLFSSQNPPQVFLSTHQAFKEISAKGNPLLNDPEWSI